MFFSEIYLNEFLNINGKIKPDSQPFMEKKKKKKKVIPFYKQKNKKRNALDSHIKGFENRKLGLTDLI